MIKSSIQPVFKLLNARSIEYYVPCKTGKQKIIILPNEECVRMLNFFYIEKYSIQSKFKAQRIFKAEI